MLSFGFTLLPIQTVIDYQPLGKDLWYATTLGGFQHLRAKIPLVSVGKPVINGEELDNILDDCLEHLLTEGKTVDQCLVTYPEHAFYLKPPLETALTISKKITFVKPRPEFCARI